jgi:hypothetical protein
VMADAWYLLWLMLGCAGCGGLLLLLWPYP